MSDSSSAVQMRRWTRQEYDRMIDAGVLTPADRVELIDGEIWPGRRKALRISPRCLWRKRRCGRQSGRNFHVRTQGPLALGTASEPEPDIAIVGGKVRDYRDHHPASAVLIVENRRQLADIRP